MIYGLDTTFLVQVDVAGHPGHNAARHLRDRLIGDGHSFALAPQVATEYLHVVTDPRRFGPPAEMDAALAQIDRWWSAAEVQPAVAGSDAMHRFLRLMRERSLGRKRLLDTMLAATYRAAGVDAIVTSNARDYAGLFGTIATP